MTNETNEVKPEPYEIYYCEKCNRYTDVRYISDKSGGRHKSVCYKCGDEMLKGIMTEEQTRQSEREKIIEIIKSNIRTDVQGNPLPQCKYFWELIKQIEGQK